MKIKQDPITKLWCREDGAVLMPPSKGRFKTFRWTFGSSDGHGYRQIQFCGKTYLVHQIICRTFHGLPPEGKSCVDHKNRVRHCNRYDNLHWVSTKENNDNAGRVDQAFEKYGVRACEDFKAYQKARYKSHCERIKACERARYAEKKAQGLVRRKGPNGKIGWFPRVRKSEAA